MLYYVARCIAPLSSPHRNSYFETRKRVIDDKGREQQQQELRQVAPWLPSFTPEAPAAAIKVRRGAQRGGDTTRHDMTHEVST